MLPGYFGHSVKPLYISNRSIPTVKDNYPKMEYSAGPIINDIKKNITEFL
jgi:hypothetical protein